MRDVEVIIVELEITNMRTGRSIVNRKSILEQKRGPYLAACKLHISPRVVFLVDSGPAHNVPSCYADC